MALKDAARILIPIGIVATALAMLIIYMFPVSCKTCSRTVEGFDTQQITMCPEYSKSFYDKKGNLNCCRGEISGDVCQGSVVCTFSGDVQGIPFCNELNRRRKYLGEVNPFIRKFLESNPRAQYTLLLNGFKQVAGNLSQVPESQLSAADKKKVNELVKEEENFLANESNAQTKLSIYEDEVMYTIQSLENLFRNKPIAQNSDFIRQQTQKVVCSVQN